MLQLAIPNKGALSETAIALLSEAGYQCRRNGRELILTDKENEIDFVFLRPRDIAIYVGSGIIDLGITGRDLTIDSSAPVVEIMPLGYGRSRFCFAVPKDSGMTVDDLNGKRIATSYPHLLKLELDKRQFSSSRIVKLDGAVEISIRLGVADAIADVVESGTTLREAGLMIVGEPMLYSEAVLIGRNQSVSQCPEVSRLLGRIRGIMLAREYAMIEYDVRKCDLEKCCALTPGVEAPTVSPLNNADWVAVKSMIKRKESNRIMDELHALGATGIIISDIRACRM